MIRIVSKRQKKVQLALQKDGYVIIDVTSSSSSDVFRKFSPFYPHQNIPVPGLANTTAASVEGIWQGLKVFENEDIDPKKFLITNMKNIKRVVGEKRGFVKGHRLSEEVIGYVDARERIYIPSYNYVLMTYLQPELEMISKLLREGQNVALVDFDTNEDVGDISKPLSHSSLVKKAVLLMF